MYNTVNGLSHQLIFIVTSSSMFDAQTHCCHFPVPRATWPQNPDTMPQAPIDPEVLAANEANPATDSVRHMAGKLNEAVGGE